MPHSATCDCLTCCDARCPHEKTIIYGRKHVYCLGCYRTISRQEKIL